MVAQSNLIARIIALVKRRVSQKHRFNYQYANNKWDALWTVPELARYSIIAGYTRHYFTSPRILDLGCGEGILQQKFSNEDYSWFLGIDFSQTAIDNAKHLANYKTRFEVADVNRFKLEDRFDVIVFNESLYYLDDPMGSISRLCNNLTPDGIFIVSMHKVGNERDWLWNSLDHVFETMDKTSVSNRENTSWTIAVYKLKNNE